MANVAEPNVTPLVLDFIVEGLELGDRLLLLKQLLASFAKVSFVLPVQVLLRLQIDDFSSEEVGKYPVVTNQGLDVVEALLETTQSVNSNVLLRCAGLLEFVVDVGVLPENVAVADTRDLIAGVAALVFTFVEEESEATLSILGLPLLPLGLGKGIVNRSER